MTRLLEILISLAIVAVLFVAVGVVLPSHRHLEHSVETNRKPTIVFDTINSLRRLRDWHPLFLRDPAAQTRLSGPDAGVGATLEYTSQARGLGEGGWKIVESEPNKRVVYEITNPERGNNKRTEFRLRPTGRNNRNVEITQTYDIDYGWNLLGRYAGLYVTSSVGEDIKLGLSRLSNMLATIPNYDYSQLAKDDPTRAPKLGQRPAENLLVVTAAVPRDNEKVKSQMLSNQEWIKKVMKDNGLEAAGPVRIVTNEFGSETYSFDVAQPVMKAGATGPATKLEGVKLEGPVTLEYNEPTRIVSSSFQGHMANLPKIRDALRGWALTHGYETTQRPYETWNNGIASGFTEDGEYNVVWAIK